jgi:hypothetical protein
LRRSHDAAASIRLHGFTIKRHAPPAAVLESRNLCIFPAALRTQMQFKCGGAALNILNFLNF